MSLRFLYNVSNAELKYLCDIIIRDTDGSFRPTEELSDTLKFKCYYPDNMKQLIPSIINELRLYGGNSIINFFRGEGPPYFEILRNVAEIFDIHADEISDDEDIEGGILKYLRLHFQEDCDQLGNSDSTKKLPLSVIIAILLKRLTGLSITNLELEEISANWISKVTSLGFLASGVFTLIRSAGHTYTVTVPAVIYIAYLRYKYMCNCMRNF